MLFSIFGILQFLQKKSCISFYSFDIFHYKLTTGVQLRMVFFYYESNENWTETTNCVYGSIARKNVHMLLAMVVHKAIKITLLMTTTDYLAIFIDMWGIQFDWMQPAESPTNTKQLSSVAFRSHLKLILFVICVWNASGCHRTWDRCTDGGFSCTIFGTAQNRRLCASCRPHSTSRKKWKRFIIFKSKWNWIYSRNGRKTHSVSLESFLHNLYFSCLNLILMTFLFLSSKESHKKTTKYI